MAAKLDIEYIEIRNFLSYGDYVTRLEVANLGPVLILGEVESDEESGSNGAGKSSLLTAFIWCLFGRTITNPNPGDKIVNWFNKKNCYVKIKTADGWEVIRTRNFDGHSELILRKDGDDETQSTNTNAQKKIIELFGLDYEIFTSSVFCGQFGKSFLEMPPTKRKETIERLLGLDRLNKYADEAKLQFKQVETRQEKTRSKVDVVKADIERQDVRLVTNCSSQKEFEENRKNRISVIVNKLSEVQQEISKLDMPDVEALEKQWKIADAILRKISDYQDQIKENQIKVSHLSEQIAKADKVKSNIELYDVPDIDELTKKHQAADRARTHISQLNEEIIKVKGQIHCLSQDIERYRNIIEEWETKSDTNCESCGQIIGPDHVEHTLSSIKNKFKGACLEQDALTNRQIDVAAAIDTLQTKTEIPKISIAEAMRLQDLNHSLVRDAEALVQQRQSMDDEKCILLEKNDKLESVVKQTLKKFEVIKPKITLEEIEQVKAVQKSLNDRLNDLSDRHEEVAKEVNPYNKIVSDLIEVVNDLKKEVESYESEIEQLDVLFQHYKYIYRSYSDRRKIKSWLLSELIPFLNDRVQYYLDMLDISFSIKFNSALNAETDRWGYEFCSGGERKRIDLAIMFGLYDLYMSIYGQQCNIMVLDEVDSRLDKKGVEAFSEIVHDICTNDERPRPSTIFVISHKQELQSLFPSQVIIKKMGHYSSIDQTVYSD